MVNMKTQGNTQLNQLSELEQVSALMDGRLSGAEFESAMMSVSAGEGRESWQVYHLIGDVLRSPDLAACQRDANFLAKLGERLQHEASRPLVAESATTVAPALGGVHIERPAANDSVFRWKLVAGFASFAAVAAIGWGAMGALNPQSVGSQLAQNEAPAALRAERAAPLTVVSLPRGTEGEAPQVMLRDPRLDELLLEHRQASGASALRDASGFLRNATFEGSGR